MFGNKDPPVDSWERHASPLKTATGFFLEETDCISFLLSRRASRDHTLSENEG